MLKPKKSYSVSSVIIISSIVLLVLIFASFLIGRYAVSPWDVFHVFFSKLTGTPCEAPDMVQSVILKIRTPRIFAAVLIGGALSVSGATYQGLFKNPMVSPDILGASSGAGFGAAVAILLSFPFVLIQGSAFLFGLAAVGLAY